MLLYNDLLLINQNMYRGYLKAKWGTLIFSSYVGSGPESTIHPQKYQEFQAPQLIFEILATPKIIPHSVPWP